jgi:hypothetical protein
VFNDRPIRPTPPPFAPRIRLPIGLRPAFWIASAGVFLANAVLSSFYGHFAAALLGMVTSAIALVAAATSRGYLTGDVDPKGPPGGAGGPGPS